MSKKEENHFTSEKIVVISALADRYLYLKEKCERIYERLTIAGSGLGRIGEMDPYAKERAMTVYAESRQKLQEEAKRLEYCRRKIGSWIRQSESITPMEKETLLLRLEDYSIREIAQKCGKTDSAIVMRLKRSGVKLMGDERASEALYNCLSRLRDASLQEE